MSIASIEHRMDYTGNGSATSFSYTYKIFSATDLLVTRRDTNDIETVLVLNVDYSVTGVNLSTGGSITLTAGALAQDCVLTIRRVRPLTQTSDIRNSGDNYREILENSFDHGIMIDQQQQDEIDRSMRLPETVTASLLLPVPIAGTVLAWNDAGTALTQRTISDLGTITEIGHGLSLTGTQLDINFYVDASYSGYANLAAADSAAVAAGKILLIRSPLTLSGANTFNAPVKSVIKDAFTGGAILFSAGLDAPLIRQFVGYNAGDIKGLKRVYPEWYVTNTTPGTTDMTSAFAQAIGTLNSAESVGGELICYGKIYLLNGTAAADGLIYGIHVPFNNLSIEGSAVSIHLIGQGRDTILKAGPSCNDIVRWSASHGSMRRFQLLGDKTTDIGLWLAPSHATSTSLGPVDQSHNQFYDLFIYQCRDGIILSTSYSANSGCYYNDFGNIHIVFSQTPHASGHRGRAIYIAYQTNMYSPANRNRFWNIMGGRLNTGIEIAVGDTNTFINCAFEDLGTEGSGTPEPNVIPTVVIIGNSPSNLHNKFIGCTAEAAVRYVELRNGKTEFYGCSFGGSNLFTVDPYVWIGGDNSNKQIWAEYRYNFAEALDSSIGPTNGTGINRLFGANLVPNIKAGINQGAAGAIAGELWQDTSAGNVIKVGV